MLDDFVFAPQTCAAIDAVVARRLRAKTEEFQFISRDYKMDRLAIRMSANEQAYQAALIRSAIDCPLPKSELAYAAFAAAVKNDQQAERQRSSDAAKPPTPAP